METEAGHMAAPESEPKVLESLLLSVAHHWSLRETGDRQVELLERHFRQDEMISAQKELAVLPRRNPGTGKGPGPGRGGDPEAAVGQGRHTQVPCPV